MAYPKRLWRELLIVVGVFFLYDRINNISTPEDRSVALNNGRDILRLEEFLRLDIERSANEWLVGNRFLGTILANFYNLAHIWVMVVIVVFVWLRRRPMYADLRNALVLFNLLGFVVFWLYPVAPPRMFDGFTDVIEQTGAISSFHSGALAPAANQFAAMPSLHMAWAIWCVVAIYRTLSSRGWRLAGWAHVILTIIAVVATANHFVLDLVGGAITSVAGFAIAALFARSVRPAIERRRAALAR